MERGLATLIELMTAKERAAASAPKPIAAPKPKPAPETKELSLSEAKAKLQELAYARKKVRELTEKLAEDKKLKEAKPAKASPKHSR